MTTIVVVKKGKEAAIAADTLTTYGSQLESARYIKNHKKIVKYRQSYFALTGWSASQTVLEDLLQKAEEEYKLGSEKEVFNWQIEIHKKLKDAYFLKADKRDSDAFETSRVNMLLANPSAGLLDTQPDGDLLSFFATGPGHPRATPENDSRLLLDRLG